MLRGVLIELSPWHDDPSMPGYQHRTAVIAVYCPHCAAHHHHGWDLADDGSVASHRVAHCHDSKSPFDASGYFISTFRKSDPEYKAHVATPGKPLVRQQGGQR